MNKQTALKALFAVSLAGLLFSGYLSYTEIFQQTCAIGGCSATVLSIPSCVYGFVMYLVGLILAGIGLKAKN